MKKITKKLLGVLLASLFILSCFTLTSCKDGKKNDDTVKDEQIDPYKDYTFPVLEVSTENGKIISKAVSQSCKVNAENTSDELRFSDANAKIKGFGDAVWRMTKKTYLLSFEEEINLLGVGTGAAADWVLAANHADVTMIRNYLAYTAAKNVLTRIPYVTGSEFIQLYINGEYEGVYQVLERVQFDENRLNYTFEAGVNDTNYLVKLDAEADIQIDSVEGTNCFSISSKKFYIDNEGVTPGQCSYVSNYYNSMMSAITNGLQTQVERYVDIDSLVDVYILHEYFKNTDVGGSGFYTVKEKGGKVVFTAPWDFFRSAGNDDSLEDTGAANLCAGNGVTKHEGANPITYRLMRRKWFVDKVVARWNEVKDALAQTTVTLEDFYSAHKSDLEANFVRWDVIGDKTDKQPEKILKLETYEEHVNYLNTWLKERHLWMDKYMNSISVYSQIKS